VCFRNSHGTRCFGERDETWKIRKANPFKQKNPMDARKAKLVLAGDGCVGKTSMFT
jgi:GTPase SAR1 family protein